MTSDGVLQILNKEDMKEVREFMKKYGALSHTWLQRQFGLNMAAAKEMKKIIKRKV